MSELKLLPCPFCGYERAFMHEVDSAAYGKKYAVSCRTKRCPAVIWELAYDLFPSKEEAVKAWNTRAPLPSDPSMIEAVARAIHDNSWYGTFEESLAYQENKERLFKAASAAITAINQELQRRNTQ